MNRTSVMAVLLLLLLHASIVSVESEAANPWQDRNLRVGDIKMHYIEAGTGDRILVFIPGWTMTAEVWRAQIPYFSARGFRVIALDPRSQGQTTKTDAGNTYQQQAADLHTFLKNLEAEHSSLVAWSSGVAALLEYVSSPEALQPDTIVLVDGGTSALKVDDFPGLMTLQQARTLFLGFQENRSEATDKYVRSLFKERQAELLYRDLIQGSMKTPMSAAISLFFDFVTGDRQHALDYVKVPTLIIAAPGNLAAAEYMNSRIPHSKLVVIEGAGSALFLDKPQAFNQALESFLEKY